MATLKTWSPFIFGGLWFLVALSLVRVMWHRHQSTKLLQEQMVRVEKQAAELLELESEVRTATSSYELERRAREELQLQLPEEKIIPVR